MHDIMESASILDFGWVLLFAAAAGMLSVRFRIPPVAGLLISGMILGPNVLHLVSTSTINTFADIGAILLLFMIGVEFSIAKLISTGLRAILSSLLLVFMTFLLMHEIAILLDFDPISALFIASMFSMSSTAIMIKILEQKKFINRQEVPVLVTMLIIEDIIAVFMLTFFSNFKVGNFQPEGIIGSVLIAFGVLAFTYIILLKAIKKFSEIFLQYQADDTIILFAFTLGIGFSALASILGLTPSIGAFLAGSLIAGLPNGRDFENAIRPFSLVFSSFFFLSIGMLISPIALISSAWVILILILSFMVIIFLTTVFSFYLITSSGRSSVFAGLAMIPLGEFSLLIAKESIGVSPHNLVGIASVAVLITSITCSATIRRYEDFYVAIKAVMPASVLHTLSDASSYFRGVISSFEANGYLHKLFITEVRSLGEDLVYLSVSVLSLWFLRPYFQFSVSFAGLSVSAFSIAIVIVILISLVPLRKVLISGKKIFDAMSVILSRTTSKASKSSILKNVLIAAFFFVLSTNSYLIVSLLLLPKIFNWVSPLFLAISLLFLWSAIRAASFSLFVGQMRALSILQKRITVSGKNLIIVAKPPQKEEENKPWKPKNKANRKADATFLIR